MSISNVPDIKSISADIDGSVSNCDESGSEPVSSVPKSEINQNRTLFSKMIKSNNENSK